uniref:(northern house mosquito) hypothetical protein n=1 Tax=Culex pipiens TaxID=7175 RepID=A0A8D8A6D4_CULPI
MNRPVLKKSDHPTVITCDRDAHSSTQAADHSCAVHSTISRKTQRRSKGAFAFAPGSERIAETSLGRLQPVSGTLNRSSFITADPPSRSAQRRRSSTPGSSNKA